MSSAVRRWRLSGDESEEVGGRGRLFSSSSQAAFLSFSQIYFPSAEGKKKMVAVATARMFTLTKRRKLVVLAENRLNEMILGPKLGETDMTRLGVCFCPVLDPIRNFPR